MKVLTIIGARPQIIKAAAISRSITKNFPDNLTEIIIHTGQHYDDNMSGVFFKELGIPNPNYNLHIGSGSHGVQTAEMITGIEKVILTEKPDCVLVYGDTNSTLAGAVAASKLHIPLVHVEAGLRSYNKKMPEEINRIVCDHCSTLLFSPTQTGLQNLEKEGFNLHSQPAFTIDNPGLFHSGDVMYDNSLYFAEIANKQSQVLVKHNLTPNQFILATIHRDFNTDIPENLQSILKSLLEISDSFKQKIFIPLHPRTAKLIKSDINNPLYNKVLNSDFIIISEPVSFFDMIALESNCNMVMTDSGGVQKEAYFFKKPCIILRPETEWVELVELGCAKLAHANKKLIVEIFRNFIQNQSALAFPQVYGDGNAADFICSKMLEVFKK